jgi:hypothetical protein
MAQMMSQGQRQRELSEIQEKQHQQNQKTNIPIATPNMMSAVRATNVRPIRELGHRCMILRSDATSQIVTSRNGASNPLMMAV